MLSTTSTASLRSIEVIVQSLHRTVPVMLIALVVILSMYVGNRTCLAEDGSVPNIVLILADDK